ncbi:MAG: tRNA (adenosine(37)-N6)-threonylcarbamoyltransferase complex ATPase subunit type 1 TsaE [Anaerolineaceae bacterium]|jgi:tRNA threonylcarbamoyladenosine biosynthesis protein TsaE|nr:MAG: tRNA (adenosine(37)-N6)-threonylcarbamoyltransferase complex ATPase subunit type 1 TsaE [Chloroflexi bacterium HGW-Chloroflexi-8]
MPILDPNSVEFFSKSSDQTKRLGSRLGSSLNIGDVICLSGNLGSGKTTFVQGMANGWGSLDLVTSPTFVIINQYRKADGGILHHMDAYRLSGAIDAIDLDMDQIISTGALVIEWPELIRSALPQNYLWIDLTWVDEFQRRIVFTAKGIHYKEILNEFRKKTFGG